LKTEEAISRPYLSVEDVEMMKDSTYRLIAWLFDAFLWGGELVGDENLSEGPAVFVSNHLGAIGPIAVLASLPVRVYPWVVSDMMDSAKAAAYLNQDFVEPQLHIAPPLSLWIAKEISRISVRLLSSAGCVPVWQGDRLHETFERSVKLLLEGKSLLIFPEDPSKEFDPQYKMTPFKKGFARLGEMYYERTGRSLRFYPLAVHLGSYRVKVGRPIAYNSKNRPVNERLRIKNVLESSVREMYLNMGMRGFPGIPIQP
jgi:1-acyl-sn-glycerol-3-phosphate acyltransferase